MSDTEALWVGGAIGLAIVVAAFILFVYKQWLLGELSWALAWPFVSSLAPSIFILVIPLNNTVHRVNATTITKSSPVPPIIPPMPPSRSQSKLLH